MQERKRLLWKVHKLPKRGVLLAIRDMNVKVASNNTGKKQLGGNKANQDTILLLSMPFYLSQRGKQIALPWTREG